jgi:hypothetical protein
MGEATTEETSFAAAVHTDAGHDHVVRTGGADDRRVTTTTAGA